MQRYWFGVRSIGRTDRYREHETTRDVLQIILRIQVWKLLEDLHGFLCSRTLIEQLHDFDYAVGKFYSQPVDDDAERSVISSWAQV